MAPIGGGPPVGSANTFTGSSKAIELVGDHCYGYNQISDVVKDTESTILEFTVSNYYAWVEIEIKGEHHIVSTSTLTFRAYMNGGLIFVDSYAHDRYEQETTPSKLIIPANTAVKLTLEHGAEATPDLGLVMTGRIYR